MTLTTDRRVPKAIGLVAMLALAVGTSACGGDELTVPPDVDVQHTVSFVGNVYDGETGGRLLAYNIEALVGDTPTAGAVDEDGRYLVGPIGAWDDFTIVIAADGYRAFRSHNARIGLPPELSGSDDIADINTHQTLHFDAYLFNTDLVAPAVTFTIQTPIPTESPEGKIRLRPTAKSVLADEGFEAPVGVPGQAWENDADLQNDTITDVFSGGSYSISEGALVYGVHYSVNIWDVVGYQPFQGGYAAGVEADKTFTLVEEVHEPIIVVSSTIATCSVSGSPNETTAAHVQIDFNQTIEFADPIWPDGNLEAVDDNFSMNSLDCDVPSDGVYNTLWPDVSANQQERGTLISINGSTLELVWNASNGLEEKDTDDVITSATYGGLSSVMIQREGGPASATTLASVIGQSSITCQGPPSCP